MYESNNISLLLYSTMSYVLNFLSFYLFYCNLKEKDLIRRKINSKKKCLYKKSVLLSFWIAKE